MLRYTGIHMHIPMLIICCLFTLIDSIFVCTTACTNEIPVANRWMMRVRLFFFFFVFFFPNWNILSYWWMFGLFGDVQFQTRKCVSLSFLFGLNGREISILTLGGWWWLQWESNHWLVSWLTTNGITFGFWHYFIFDFESLPHYQHRHHRRRQSLSSLPFIWNGTNLP